MVSLYNPITTKDFIKYGQITTVEQNDWKKRIVTTYRLKSFNPNYKTNHPRGVSYEGVETTYYDSDGRVRGTVTGYWTSNSLPFDKVLKRINGIIEKSKIEQPENKIYLVTTSIPKDIEYEYYYHINHYLYPESFEGHKTSLPQRKKAAPKKTAVRVNVRKMF